MNPRISLELVPRDSASLKRELLAVSQRFSAVDTINIPEQPRFAVRALDGARLARQYARRGIPHLRSRDHSAAALPRLARRLQRDGATEVIVVAGDAHRPATDTLTPTAMIAGLVRLLPDLQVYAALDPYRLGPLDELNGLQRKLDAGAAGVFTQPFFDLRLQAAWQALLPEGLTVFWGIAPILSEAAVQHWQKMARVALPTGFQPTRQWNAALARRLLARAHGQGQHVYLMPVRCDPLDYLEQVLTPAAA